MGVIYTRTGRRFFDKGKETEILSRLNDELQSKRYFEKYETDYVLLDAEIMPWNLKAKDLISEQYAHVSENAILNRMKLKEKLAFAAEKNEDLTRFLDRNRRET